MRKSFFIAMATLLGCASPGLALSPVTYASSTGGLVANGFDCSNINPCSQISEAISQATSGGTVILLDNGIFTQTTTINKSITILGALNPTIVPTAGNPAFSINTAGVAFELQNVTLNGLSGATFGINVTNAASVRIKNTTIKNFNTGGIVGAILVKPSGGVTTKFSVENSDVTLNKFGIIADGSTAGIVRGAVTNSFVGGNVNNGITVSTTGSNIVLLVKEATINGNGAGLVATGTNAGMLVDKTSIVGNTTGLSTSGGGVLFSYNNNNVNGNTADGAFTGVIALH